MKKGTLLTVWTVMLVIFITVFAACGASGNAGRKESYNGSYYVDEAKDSPAAYDNEFPTGKYDEGNPAANDIDVADKDTDIVKPDRTAQKLIYTCNMRMETTEFEKTLTALRGLIAKYDAFIESESQTDSAGTWYYSSYRKTSGTLSERIVIRVPSENYDAFLADLDGQGKIREKNTNVENITQSYTDTETIIASLKTQEKRLLEMMESCETIEDMITVEDRLTEVQTELAVYESRLKGMDLDVSYSTVDLTLTEVLEYSSDSDPVYTATFGDRLKNTLKESWENVKSFLEELLFFLIRALPILLIIGAIGGLIAFIIVKSIKGSKKRRAAKRAKAEAAKAAQAQARQ